MTRKSARKVRAKIQCVSTILQHPATTVPQRSGRPSFSASHTILQTCVGTNDVGTIILQSSILREKSVPSSAFSFLPPNMSVGPISVEHSSRLNPTPAEWTRRSTLRAATSFITHRCMYVRNSAAQSCVVCSWIEEGGTMI